MIFNTFTEERIKELATKLNSSSKEDMKSGQKIAVFSLQCVRNYHYLHFKCLYIYEQIKFEDHNV